jgi:hypothetical protein
MEGLAFHFRLEIHQMIATLRRQITDALNEKCIKLGFSKCGHFLARKVSAELAAVAKDFGIPLSARGLSDVAAQEINDFEPLFDDRAVWLLVYEGCRLATMSLVALWFAG